MKGLFGSIAGYKPKKNKFDLSHEKKMSMKMGTLTPFMLQEVMPGDSFRVNTEMLMRLQPMLAPIYHRVRVKTDYFFVPNRLVWDNWQKFITGGDDGQDASVHPYMEIKDSTRPYYGKGSLSDYMGIPTVSPTAPITANIKINALPFRAYTAIWNEYYRDQNLQEAINFSKGDGLVDDFQTSLINALRKRAWEKDYFTSALPWAQKGGAVSAPITGDIVGTSLRASQVLKESDSTAAAGALTSTLGELQAPNGTDAFMPVTGEVDMTGGMTINDLRVAVRLQEWLERNARAGSRYIENILSNFGVLSSDARLQRPEYLGGSINPIVISEVLSTFQATDQQGDDTGYPQGNMSGHGISTGGNGGFKKRFEEHGYVIGIMTVLPRTAYQQGLNKTFSRFDKFDYAWPSFAQLGEQEIKMKELYMDAQAGGDQNEQTFGYQSRYAEYKYQPSTVHGDFKDNLSFWHMGRIFTAPPALNESFITADPTKRIFAVEDQTEDEILCQIYNRVDAIRPLPFFNSPTL